MEEPINRMVGRRGRPGKAEQIEREAVPQPDIVDETVPAPKKRLGCTRCGCDFEPKIIRTVGDMRKVRCDRCGYTHSVHNDLAVRLGWIAP